MSLEDAVPQYEAKVLLVGEGNVGKTSLIAALHRERFIDGRSTTHGIEIQPLVLSHPSLSRSMTLRTWDFGGQEVYRITHQFFFTKRALYMVVWSAREGQERNEVEDWLKRIRMRVASEARVVIVATHCDERSPELDYPQLKRTFADVLRGSVEVDNRTSSGIERLRAALADEAADLPQMGQLVSPRWIATRDEVLSRAATNPQISFADFAATCKGCGVTDDGEIRTLAEYLHDLGQVIYYGDDEGLKDVVVLNPEWLTKAISYVLEDRVTRNSYGILDHHRLKEIWQDGPDGQSYPGRYHRYFLRLMEKFDVSYRLEDGDASLVPQLLPHERPDLPWEPDEDLPSSTRSLSLICKLNEPAPGLIAWLTVRHHRASTNMHWRRGIFLRHPIATYESDALIELRQADELHLDVRAPSPDLFFNVLRDSIESLVSARWPGIAYQLLIPCTTRFTDGSRCEYRFPLDGLLRYRERGGLTYACLGCGQDHHVSRLLTGFDFPAGSIKPELDRLEKQVSDIASGVGRLESVAAQTAESVRRILRIASTEVKDCPRLFNLMPDASEGIRGSGASTGARTRSPCGASTPTTGTRGRMRPTPSTSPGNGCCRSGRTRRWWCGRCAWSPRSPRPSPAAACSEPTWPRSGPSSGPWPRCCRIPGVRRRGSGPRRSAEVRAWPGTRRGPGAARLPGLPVRTGQDADLRRPEPGAGSVRRISLGLPDAQDRVRPRASRHTQQLVRPDRGPLP